MVTGEKNVNKADAEMQDIFKWANEQEQLRMEELKKQGKWQDGLDGNEGVFDDIKAERDRKLYALAEKYGIKVD